MVKGLSTTTFTGSVGMQAGVKSFGCDEIAIFGARAEGKAERNGFYAKAGLTAGTAVSADIELGKEFDINKNWGLDLSANASKTKSLLGKSSSDITYNIDLPTSHVEWTPGVAAAGVKAMANYTSNNGKLSFKAGVSGQYVSNSASNNALSARITDNQGNTQIMQTCIKKHKQGVVISPELQAEYKINNKLSLNASANTLGGSAGISYTFQ